MANSVTIVQKEIQTMTVASPGIQGIPGKGIPAGGTVGQMLVKSSGDDFDTEWFDRDNGKAVDAVIQINGDGTVTILRSFGRQEILASDVTLTSTSIQISTDTSFTTADSILLTDVYDSNVICHVLKGYVENGDIVVHGWDILNSSTQANPLTDIMRIAILVNPT